MIQKKICMLGYFAVGKTSLVQRFVKSIFSDKYLTTVGVKIDKKTVSVNGQEVNLMLWDISGEDEFQKVKASYLRGTSGYLIVVDATRKETLNRAVEIQSKTQEITGKIPFMMIINKMDLTEELELDYSKIEELEKNGFNFIYTSAKTGDKVEDAFITLASQMTKDIL
jgi:small GTP-binding protein